MKFSTGYLKIVFLLMAFALCKEVVFAQQLKQKDTAKENKELEEVVVTALGIKRSQKALTYATQAIDASKLNIARTNTVSEGLAGKIAGLQFRGQSGAALGRTNQIRLRGAGSLSEKDALYVVDGTPITNPEDVNPDDVQSVTVLKGPSAAALYGQRGEGGVILVTTKSGAGGKAWNVSLSNNTTFDNVYVLQRFQNDYAGGSVAQLTKFTYKAAMPAAWKNFDGKYFHDFSDDASWGPRMLGQEYIPWYALNPNSPYAGKTARLTPQPSNIRDFYQTGVNTSTNLSITKNIGDRGGFRLSLTAQNVDGILPSTSQQKYTISTAINTEITRFISLNVNLNYVNSTIHGQFDDDYSNQSSGSFNQWFHRDVDMAKLRELQDVNINGVYASWNTFNPDQYEADNRNENFMGYYWVNPYTYFNKMINYQRENKRLFGNAGLTFNLYKNELTLSTTARSSVAFTNAENKRYRILALSHYGTISRPTDQLNWDYYENLVNIAYENNFDILLSYNKKIKDFDISANAGYNDRTNYFETNNSQTRDGLIIPDFFSISNSRRIPPLIRNMQYTKKVRSFFVRASLGYKGIIFLDGSVRNDNTSALPKGNNSYYYPSAGVSFLALDALSKWGNIRVNPRVLSYAKLRFNFAQIGSDVDPHLLGTYYTIGANQFFNNLTMSVPNLIADNNLRPSLSSSYEAGIDLKFFNNKLSLNGTYFTERRNDEIVPVGISSATGYRNNLINAATVSRNGFELEVVLNPYSSKNIDVEIGFNWATVNSTIDELGVEAYAPTFGSAFTSTPSARTSGGPSFTGLATVYQIRGERWGQLRGIGIRRNAKGLPILDKDGLYIAETDKNFGSVLPDFTGGFYLQVRLYGFTIAGNLDFQAGGKYFSLSDYFGSYSGLTAKTSGLNDKGFSIRDASSSGGGVRVDGVTEKGDPITKYVDAQTYFHQFGDKTISEPYIYGLSYVKLRELSVSYDIPIKKSVFFSKCFSSARVGFVARNLWLIYADNRDFDPSEIADIYGEVGQFPSVRSFGFNIKLNF